MKFEASNASILSVQLVLALPYYYIIYIYMYIYIYVCTPMLHTSSGYTCCMKTEG